jgi:ubiquinone/menaquinone biosynthesis C-methylase UbiE
MPTRKPPEVSTEEVIARWDHAAQRILAAYTATGDTVREQLINPDIFALLGNLQGKDVLDAGCGEGYLARLIKSQGARTVVGIDYCKPLLRRALTIETQYPQSINFLHMDYQHMHALGDNSFDYVVSNMVLMDIPDYVAAIRETSRVLRPEGVFVCSIIHPCFITPDSNWCQCEADKNVWHVNKYFDRLCHEQIFPAATKAYRFTAADNPPYIFHRPLADYVGALVKQGFAVTGLKEAEPKISKDVPGHGQITWYLTIRAEKLDNRTRTG